MGNTKGRYLICQPHFHCIFISVQESKDPVMSFIDQLCDLILILQLSC